MNVKWRKTLKILNLDFHCQFPANKLMPGNLVADKEMVFRQSIHSQWTSSCRRLSCISSLALSLGKGSTALHNRRSNKLYKVTPTTARATEREYYSSDNSGKYQEVPQQVKVFNTFHTTHTTPLTMFTGVWPQAVTSANSQRLTTASYYHTYPNIRQFFFSNHLKNGGWSP